MIITYLISNWKKIFLGGLITLILGYYAVIKHEITVLKIKNTELTTLTKSQLDEIDSQKLAYAVLNSDMQIREAAIESLNTTISNERAKHENDQNKITQNKTKIDNTNRISMLWLRLAFGDMSAIPNATATLNDTPNAAGYILPSAADHAINKYVESCEIVVMQLNTLIDEIESSGSNYNTLAIHNENQI